MKRCSFLVFVSLIMILSSATSVLAVPETVGYQGRLLDATGQPMADDSYTFTFRLYDDITGGNLLWEESETVNTTEGYFATTLGNTTPLDFSTFGVNPDQLYLEIQLQGESPMTPRTRLNPVPQAVSSKSVNGDIQTAKGSAVIDALDDDDDDDGISVDDNSNDSKIEIKEVDDLGDASILRLRAHNPDEPEYGNITFERVTNGGSTSDTLMNFMGGADGSVLEYRGGAGGAGGSIYIEAPAVNEPVTGTLPKITLRENNDLMGMNPDYRCIMSPRDIMLTDSIGDSSIVLNGEEKQYRGKVTLLKFAPNGLGQDTRYQGRFSPELLELSSTNLSGGGVENGGMIVSADSITRIDSSGNPVYALRTDGTDVEQEVFKQGFGQTHGVRQFAQGDSSGTIVRSYNETSGEGMLTELRCSMPSGDSARYTMSSRAIMNSGLDTTEVFKLRATAKGAQMEFPDSLGDSGIVINGEEKQYRGKVTILKFAPNGLGEDVRHQGSFSGESLEMTNTTLTGGGGIENGGTIVSADSIALVDSSGTPRVALKKADHVALVGFGSFSLNSVDTAFAVDTLGNAKFAGSMSVGTPEDLATLTVGGDICATGSIGSCSDLRYKKDINSLTNALQKVAKLRAVSFEWDRKNHPEMHFSGNRHVGFIAQEVKDIFPEVVNMTSNGYYTIDYSKLTPLLVEAIQEQQNTINQLQQQVDASENLQTQLQNLQAQIDKLNEMVSNSSANQAMH